MSHTKEKSIWSSSLAVLVGTILLIIGAIAIIAYFLTGKTVTTGEGMDEVRDAVVLSCKSTNFNYPFFRYDNSESKLAVVDVRFNDDKVQSISAKFTLSYDTEKGATDSKLQNQASLGIAFGADGLTADDLSTGCSIQGNDALISLYANANAYNDVTKKYFFVGDIDIDSSIEEYDRNYQSQGFICTETE